MVGVRLFFVVYFAFFLFVDALTVELTVDWVCNLCYISFGLHLRHFMPYDHSYLFSFLNCSGLIKGL